MQGHFLVLVHQNAAIVRLALHRLLVQLVAPRVVQGYIPSAKHCALVVQQENIPLMPQPPQSMHASHAQQAITPVEQAPPSALPVPQPSTVHQVLMHPSHALLEVSVRIRRP